METTGAKAAEESIALLDSRMLENLTDIKPRLDSFHGHEIHAYFVEVSLHRFN